jgi:hypothetical protein
MGALGMGLTRIASAISPITTAGPHGPRLSTNDLSAWESKTVINSAESRSSQYAAPRASTRARPATIRERFMNTLSMA